MRRILSLIVALVIILGATNLFAVAADWNGYYRFKYRNIVSDPKEDLYGGNTSFEETMWQKLDLKATWKASDKVSVSAIFFTSNYWGSGRFYSAMGGNSVALDSGVWGTGTKNNDPLSTTMGTPNTTLGIYAAWVNMNFMEGSLMVDFGRVAYSGWGTKALLGDNGTDDRIQFTYIMKGVGGGTLMPLLILANRLDQKAAYDTNITAHTPGAVYMIQLGAVYLKPGTLAGIVINPNIMQKNASSPQNGPVYNGNAPANLWVVDLYAEHLISMGDMSIKPIFEALWSFGTIINNASVAVAKFGTEQYGDAIMDAKTFLLKAEITMKKLVKITPELGLTLAPKEGKQGESYVQAYGFNMYHGDYTIGKILNSGGVFGLNQQLLSQFYMVKSADGTNKIKNPHWFYAKLQFDADILNEFVPGLNAYLAVIYAKTLGKQKYTNLTTGASTEIVDSDKSVITELDLGLIYKIDSTTNIKLEGGMAKWGKNSIASYIGAYGWDKRADTDWYLGADLEVKF